MANLTFGEKFLEALRSGRITKVFQVLTFDISVNSGEVVSLDQRTPSDGVFQVEYINFIGTDPIKMQIRDTYTNRNWFSDFTYIPAIAGDGKSAGFLPSPILVNPSTQILIQATYDSNDPLTSGADSATGQLVIGGFVLVGLMSVEDIFK